MPTTDPQMEQEHSPDGQAANPLQETNRMIMWSSLVLGFVLVSGLVLWSQAGSAVFFDRISGAIAGCF